MTMASRCVGDGGFDTFCWETYGECGAKPSGGFMWHDGDTRPKGRFAKRAAVVKPTVAGFWDAGEGKQCRLSISAEVPAEVITALVEVVEGNVEYKDLDGLIKAFEITN
jgi:hypothetical protein